MLDIKRIRENEAEIRQGLVSRNADLSLLDKVIELDAERRKLLTEVEAQKNKRNMVSKEIGLLKKKGEDTSAIQASVREIGDLIANSDTRIKEIETEFADAILRIPNVPHSSTPIGNSADDNKLVRTWGTPRKFNFEPKNHLEIGENLNIMDFERATKIAGPGFSLLTGQGARLQRALIQFMLDVHVNEHGYTEIWPPALVNTAAMTGTGQLPKMAEDMYHAEVDDLWLIPTAEVPVTNVFMNEIITRSLPIYLTAYTPCFRREAGAAGRETRGLIRLHQFDKVEMVKFVDPSKSYEELESLTLNAEDILQKLGLHYRVIALCSGDISFSAAKCYDIELWAPGQNTWLEVSSCSNFEDFQARRAGIKFKDTNGKTRFLHTLNGSGVALPRLVVAILENYQMEDGSVALPEALAPYMGGITHITKQEQ